MKTASYISTQTASGGAGQYPLSTQTLDFIQSQILLLQNLSLIGGKRYILREPDGEKTGIVVIDGEVLIMTAKPVMANNIKYITVQTEKEDIEADGETYIEARTQRTASYAISKTGGEDYEINTFTNFAPNSTLVAQIKQMPETVLTYLRDVMNEKLSSLEVTGMTKKKLDSIKTACIISCRDSIALFSGQTNYSIMVRLMGGLVHQELTLPDNQKFVRTFDGTSWTSWGRVNENLHIEVKISKGTVFLRHGHLPFDASILLLRKKKRSKFRSTGGDHSYPKNKGKRVNRLPKTQYVHFKGIVLSQGVPGKWYVPKCVSVANKNVDGDLIDKELPTLCRSMIRELSRDGITYYRIQGVRNEVTTRNAKHCQHRGYAPIAIQVARHKDNVSKDSGGEMVRMKYRISRKKYLRGDKSYSYTYYRGFSLE